MRKKVPQSKYVALHLCNLHFDLEVATFSFSVHVNQPYMIEKNGHNIDSVGLFFIFPLNNQGLTCLE